MTQFSLQSLPKNLVINSATVPPFQAADTIVRDGTIDINDNTTYKASKSILLAPAAEQAITITPGSVFLAKIEGCNNNN